MTIPMVLHAFGPGESVGFTDAKDIQPHKRLQQKEKVLRNKKKFKKTLPLLLLSTRYCISLPKINSVHLLIVNKKMGKCC